MKDSIPSTPPPFETWKKKVEDFKARLMDQICPRCERIVARKNGFPSAAEMKRQQDLEARERNWNDSVVLEMFDADILMKRSNDK